MDDLWRRHRSEKFNETPGKGGRREGRKERTLGLSRIEISDREEGKQKIDRDALSFRSYVFQVKKERYGRTAACSLKEK